LDLVHSTFFKNVKNTAPFLEQCVTPKGKKKGAALSMETDKRAILNIFASFHIHIFHLQLSYYMLRGYHPTADHDTEELRGGECLTTDSNW
jgi:hypothetical protein